jgi:hypothetical protein
LASKPRGRVKTRCSASTARRKLAPLTKVRRAIAHCACVGRQNMDAALVDHPLGRESGSSAESASQGNRRYLHPNARLRQPPDCLIARLDPGKLRMSQNRNISRRHHIEEEFLQTRRSFVMRGLAEHKANVGE